MKKKTVCLILCTALLVMASGCGAEKQGSELNSNEQQDQILNDMNREDKPEGQINDNPKENQTANNNEEKSHYVAEVLCETEGGTVSAYNKDGTDYNLTIYDDKELHNVSDTLFGIFFEDINFAADGGLYAEMVKNRSFEFTELAKDDAFHGWSTVGKAEARVVTDEESSLNENNINYLVLKNDSEEPVGVANVGFLDGMSIDAGKEYLFSVWAKGIDGFSGNMYVSLTVSGNEVCSDVIKINSGEWEKYTLTLKPNKKNSSSVKLNLKIDNGAVALDMVSLFPKDTYKGRNNGLRADLCEKLEQLNPKFLRFPGGCVIEGTSLQYAYDWKDSIGVDGNGDPLYFNGTYGDVAVRKQGQNIWTDTGTRNDIHPSFMTYGLGFYEFFQLSEDLGALAVPVVNCGMACQVRGGKSAAIGSNQMKKYIRDALDLVEFCRGDATTKWGKVRVAMGHEEPFVLRYIAIGNEQWGEDYFRHYNEFVNAFEEAAKLNPELFEGIELIYSSGTDDGDSGAEIYIPSYENAEKWLAENPDKELTEFASATDHHYYNSPEWFLSHTDYYNPENYTRNQEKFAKSKYGGGINVFLGEYAAQSNTWRAALAEAAYMTGLEKNSDIVVMAAYAPLFGNLTRTHWAPDLIWFNNHLVTASVNYYVQQVFARNTGKTVIYSQLEGAEIETKPLSGMVGVATWSTAAKFDNVKITNNETGQVLAEDLFDDNKSLVNWKKVTDGNWEVKDGKLVQSNSNTNVNAFATTGAAMYFGDVDWTNYTYELDATKTGGAEAFLIPFAVKDKNNNYFWNIGGWGNTVSCLQQVENGVKSGQLSGTVKNCSLKSNKTYHIKVVVNENRIQCYLDGELYVDYITNDSKSYESYQVVSTDEAGDLIVKLVNVTGEEKTFGINIENSKSLSGKGTIESVVGESLAADNILGKTPQVILKSYEVSNLSSAFNFTVPAYSVTVLRLQR